MSHPNWIQLGIKGHTRRCSLYRPLTIPSMSLQVPLHNNGHIDEGAEITAWNWDVSVKQNDIMETISIFGHVKQLNLPPLSIVTIAAVHP